MAQIGHFDATQVEPSAPQGEVIPPGDYLVQIIKSEMTPTKAGTGQMLVLEMEIMEGEHARRHLWDRLNLVNPNATAVEISQRTLSAICHAVGVLQVSDSEALHFKPMLASVIVLPTGVDKSGYERKSPQNEVKGYKPAGGAQRPAAPVQQRPAQAYQPPQQQAPAPQTTAPASASTPPWRRGKAA